MAGMSDSLAFRRLVATVAEKISEEEVRKLVYIYLYSQRETIFRNVESLRLKVFVALEFSGTFSPARPEGLLGILEKDLKNRHLANLVKGYIRERKRKSVNLAELNGDRGVGVYTEPSELENDTHLRMCYKMALAQTNVLVKHLDALRDAVAKEGAGATPDGAAREALENISKAAGALAKLKEKADAGLEIISSVTNSIRSNAVISATELDEEESEEEQGEYEDVITMTVGSTDALFEEIKFGPPSSLTAPSPRPESLPPPLPKQKPPLRPKPVKLKAPLQSWNVPGSGFDSSRASSMPQLDTVGETQPPSKGSKDTDKGEENEDDYIEPLALEEDGSFNFRGVHSKKLVTKTISMPHIQSPSRKIFNKLNVLMRPLSNSLRRHQDAVVTGKLSGKEEEEMYEQIEAEEDSEPIYDDINENTLLSRMARPSVVSSSSSD